MDDIKVFRLKVYGHSVPDARPRTEPVYTKNGPLIVKGRVITNTRVPVKALEWRRVIIGEAQRVVREGFKMFSEDDALVMSLVAVYMRPKSVSAKKRPYHIVKPDLDNIEKNIKDGLSKVIYPDDKQVIAHVEPYIKRYVENDEQPFVKIIIMRYEDWMDCGII